MNVIYSLEWPLFCDLVSGGYNSDLCDCCNFLPMRPATSVVRGVEIALPTLFNSLLFDQCIELPQLV
jgi:hypothetical protein